MNRIGEFYESNHLLILTIIIVVTLIITINKNQKIKKLISKVGEMKVKITEFEVIKIKTISKTITTGSLVRLKYVLTGEIINILISENENLKFNINSEIIRINVKTPLALALLGKQEGNTIKFKKSLSDEQEVYVVILDVNNGFNSDTETAIIENNELEIIMVSENIEKKVQPSSHKEKPNTNQGRLDGPRLSVSYFILDENWFGQNKIITVTFIGGNYNGRIFKYYHDEVYLGTIQHYQNLNCWKNYSRYSNSRNIPSLAQPFVTEII